MKKVNTLSLPLAVNVCEQMLREMDRTARWSVAHVIMNPLAHSILHRHFHMREIYMITRGVGELTVGERTPSVHPGNVIFIPDRMPHKLVNAGITTLEHLVLASPPFISSDVELLKDRAPRKVPTPAPLPEMVECFDGAQIIAYEYPGIASIAIGRVVADPKRHKPAHYHKKTIEWVYVLEGMGSIEVDSVKHPIGPSDWIQIDKGEAHALRNENTRDLVVMCICTPEFSMDDVFYAITG